MGKTTGFMDYSRELAPRRPVLERVNDWFEIYQDFPEAELRKQGAQESQCREPGNLVDLDRNLWTTGGL